MRQEDSNIKVEQSTLQQVDVYMYMTDTFYKRLACRRNQAYSTHFQASQHLLISHTYTLHIQLA